MCGLCCLHARELIDAHKDSMFTREAARKFPYKFDQGGACEKFDKETKLCTVYETRPEICQVEAMYKHFPVKTGIEEYYRLNEVACKTLQQEESVDRAVAIPAEQKAGMLELAQADSAGGGT